MLTWEGDLKLSQTDWYLDAKRPRPKSFISHAHSDHLAPHTHALLTSATFRLTEARTTLGSTSQIEYHKNFTLSDGYIAKLLPAGHVLGSSMLHVTGSDGSLLYTGDYKLRTGLTCPPAELEGADQLLMECTYGLPFFRFPKIEIVREQLVEGARLAIREGRQPLVLGYSLGKAQEICRILADAGLAVTVHGAVARLNAAYESLGVYVGPWRRYVREDFHGEKALPLEERGVLVAPPNCARGGFSQSFEKRWTVVMSGWGLEKGAKYRYGVDDVLPMSDHADYDELMETIERVEPKVVWLHHGYVKELTDALRGKGLDARPAEPEAQMSLF